MCLSSLSLLSEDNPVLFGAILLDRGINAIRELNLVTGSVGRDKNLVGRCVGKFDTSDFSSHHLIRLPFGSGRFLCFSFLVLAQ